MQLSLKRDLLQTYQEKMSSCAVAQMTLHKKMKRKKKNTEFAVLLVARLFVFPKCSAQIQLRLPTKAIQKVRGKNITV